MIAHDICLPSFKSFCQHRIFSELEDNADSHIMIGTGDYLVAQFWVFSDGSVALSVPGQIVKAFPSFDQALKSNPLLQPFFSHC